MPRARKLTTGLSSWARLLLACIAEHTRIDADGDARGLYIWDADATWCEALHKRHYFSMDGRGTRGAIQALLNRGLIELMKCGSLNHVYRATDNGKIAFEKEIKPHYEAAKAEEQARLKAEHDAW